jgi:hypothetical protein
MKMYSTHEKPELHTRFLVVKGNVSHYLKQYEVAVCVVCSRTITDDMEAVVEFGASKIPFLFHSDCFRNQRREVRP